MRLSFVEFIAVFFAALAGIASAVQAYVSWETRGEVSRAIVFAERIDACATMIAALQPFVVKARPDARARVASGAGDGRYSLPGYFYRTTSGNPGFRAAHGPRIERVRVAAAGVAIVMPPSAAERLAYFEKALGGDIPAGEFFSQGEMLAWLERLDAEVNGLTADCRGYLENPPASAGDGLSWW